MIQERKKAEEEAAKRAEAEAKRAAEAEEERTKKWTAEFERQQEQLRKEAQEELRVRCHKASVHYDYSMLMRQGLVPAGAGGDGEGTTEECQRDSETLLQRGSKEVRPASSRRSLLCFCCLHRQVL